MNPRTNLLKSLAPACAMLMTASMVFPQIGPYEPIDPVPYCPEIVTAFVDANQGSNPPPIATALRAHLNAGLSFRTIQMAIDACQLGVIDVYNDSSIPNHLNARGVVLCMPGTYGPTGVQAGPKDDLPIVIRDRVSLRGHGARRVILRGESPDATPRTVFWPNASTCGTYSDREVLVDFAFEWTDQQYESSPWGDNSEEFVDSLTFQGGDVQVYFDDEGDRLGRVSNCLFDMRHDPTGVPGPYFGIEIVHGYDPNFPPPGYFFHPVNILNNTFILGEVCPAGVSALLARPEAVAIIDVTDPKCLSASPDPITTLRGIGKPSIQNNLIRDLPSQTTQRVLLGVDGSDTTTAIGTSPGTTNSFRDSRIGGTNNTFYSVLLSPAPVAAVDLDSLPNDPPFVGEALASSLPLFPSYRDWRLLPGSIVGSLPRIPQEDEGSGPVFSSGTVRLVATNGTTYTEPFCNQLSSFYNDGESYGNPRSIGEVDIGFDECHMMVMAGTWANLSNSHNLPDLSIDPNLGTGAARRMILFSRQLAGGQVTINGTKVAYSPAPWGHQPGTKFPPSTDGSLPAFYQKKYISFSNNPTSNPAMPWTGVIGSTTLVNPVSSISYVVGVRVVVDNETGPGTFFNTQAVAVSGPDTYRGNLQSEYR